MHILTTSTNAQTLKVNARTNVFDVRVVLFDKSEKKELSVIDDECTTIDGITTIEVEFDGNKQLVEGRYYSLTVKDRDNNDAVVYKGLVFCTNQTDYNKYEVGKNDYTEETSYDNEFIII